MLKYIGKRLLMMIPVLLGVIFIVFSLIEITPGDPVRLMLGDSAREEDVIAMREELGLDDPFLVKFGRYVTGLVTRGDFGTSYESGRPVMTEIMERFPMTLKLAVLSAAVAVIFGVVCGIISATRQYSIFDNVATAVSLIGVSMPNFWQGLMAVLIFSVWLKWLPASGSYGPEYWVLPALTLGTSCAASIMRTTRSSMLEVVRQDYIRTARAKGQSEKIVVLRHALKNALIPVITVIGIQFGSLLGGSVLVESVFAMPGLGKYMIDAIKMRDFPVVQGSVLFLAIAFSFVNLAVDIIYSFIDPRIKSQYKSNKKKKEATANG
ncbi:MAG: nickel ABC transporter permease [Angelakisella sp.]|nr:nickel ABC transporter permease [Angelakisella sp.]